MAAPTTQTHGGMRGALDPELYDINEDEWGFFSAWTKIEDREEFKALVMDVQKRTYAIVSHVRRPANSHADDSPASTLSPSSMPRPRRATATIGL